jgi:hypothetical protein
LHLKTFLLGLLVGSLNADYYERIHLEPIYNSYNSLGQTGIIHLPNASIQENGSLGFIVVNSSLNKLLSIVASPIKFLEVGFFYQQPTDTLYLSNKANYLDKGFNVKLARSLNNLDIAIGIDDIAGTGRLSKEYLVATYNTNEFKLTLGIGTGALAFEDQYKNPIKGFELRPNTNFYSEIGNKGGTLDIDTYFKGPVGIFGGIEYYSSIYPGLVIKLESNPYDYTKFLAGGRPSSTFLDNRRKNKKFNIGIHYKFKHDINLGISILKDKGFDINVSKKINLNKVPVQSKPSKATSVSKSLDEDFGFYEDLLRNLEKEKIYVQSMQIDNEDIKVAVVNNSLKSSKISFEDINTTIQDLAEQKNRKIKYLSVTEMYSGFEIGTVTARSKNPLIPSRTGKQTINEPMNDTKDFEYQTILKFPEIYFNIKPEFIYRYADPARFFAGGFDLQLDTEIKFSTNLYITSVVSQQLWNSFQRVRDFPDSPYLPHVRTDVVKYLNNRNSLYLNTFQLNHINKINNNHFLQLSMGYYEMMFGGYGVEYLWKPFYKNYALGISAFNVKQRDFNQRFDFQNYETTTGFIDFIYYFNKIDISSKLSIGKYLAKDKGYTFELTKHFKSGMAIGGYFTRTNISPIIYGEGSFDKGFFFDIPLNIFNPTIKTSRILIQPLTRDGGARLKTGNPLFINSHIKNNIGFRQE